MKILTSLLLFALSSQIFGQGIGSGGGKGPDEDASSRCSDMNFEVSVLEEKFVKMYGLKYKDQKDFFKLLEKIIVDSTAHVLDKMHQHNHTKNGDTCPEAEVSSKDFVAKLRPDKKTEVSILEGIKKIYLEEKKATPKCLQFNYRVHNIETLEHVLKFYE